MATTSCLRNNVKSLGTLPCTIAKIIRCQANLLLHAHCSLREYLTHRSIHPSPLSSHLPLPLPPPSHLPPSLPPSAPSLIPQSNISIAWWHLELYTIVSYLTIPWGTGNYLEKGSGEEHRASTLAFTTTDCTWHSDESTLALQQSSTATSIHTQESHHRIGRCAGVEHSSTLKPTIHKAT